MPAAGSSLGAATRAELERVHTAAYLDHLERFCAGAAATSTPTPARRPRRGTPRVLAAGSGLEAVDGTRTRRRRLRVLRGPTARPPRGRGPRDGLLSVQQRRGHRRRAARPGRAGADRRLGRAPRQRHPGHLLRPTARCLYVSMHEWPLYPGTGRLDDVGRGAGAGTTVNFPLPAGATGDVYLDALDTVVAPLAERFAPDVGARVGRVRRPPRRSVDRPRPRRRATTPTSRPACWRLAAPRPARGRSSRAATTWTRCAIRSPRPSRRCWVRRSRRRARHCGRPGPTRVVRRRLRRSPAPKGPLAPG